MSIHKLIREGRKRLCMSEAAFGKACGVSRGAVQQWETEGGTAPNRSRQKVVAELLGIAVEELVSGRGRKDPYSEHAMRLAQIYDSVADPERRRLIYASAHLLASAEATLMTKEEAPPLPEPSAAPGPAR